MRNYNEFQKIAMSCYQDGHFADPEVAEGILESRGDTNFSCIMIELGTDEGCDTSEEAIRRLEAMIEDVEGVITALRAAA